MKYKISKERAEEIFIQTLENPEKIRYRTNILLICTLPYLALIKYAIVLFGNHPVLSLDISLVIYTLFIGFYFKDGLR